MAFLTINAFDLIVPMMPERRAKSETAIPDSVLSEAFYDLEAREALVGLPNALPLALDLNLGAFKPRLITERRAAAA